MPPIISVPSSEHAAAGSGLEALQAKRLSLQAQLGWSILYGSVLESCPIIVFPFEILSLLSGNSSLGRTMGGIGGIGGSSRRCGGQLDMGRLRRRSNK